MSINSRFKSGPATSKPARGVQGLSSIKPEMMHRVLSSIKRAKASEAQSQAKLLEFFPENRATVKCSVERDFAFSCQNDGRFSSLAEPLPRIQDSRSLSGGAQDKQCAAQMTIFYNGAVNVYNVSEEKAEALMTLARNTSSKSMAPLICSEQISKHGDSKDEQVQKLGGGLPITRKLSLQRFLEKRKDRLRNTSPYSSTWTANSGFDNYKEEGVEQHMKLSLGIPIP